MSEYVMFYVRDDASAHWIELNSFSRNTQMFRFATNRINEWYTWREIDDGDLQALNSDIAAAISRQQDMIKQYEADNEYLKSTQRPLDEIMEYKRENDAMIEECRRMLDELTSCLNEIKLYECFIENSSYSSNKVHLCIAHESNPNTNAGETEN